MDGIEGFVQTKLNLNDIRTRFFTTFLEANTLAIP